mmetsp:Transcript_9846/g.23525  ORF Transcript_9846/g.23525 Transcript_9846/m.23525 type:complete len:449 (-) Transcript_9846:125-1471(-)
MLQNALFGASDSDDSEGQGSPQASGGSADVAHPGSAHQQAHEKPNQRDIPGLMDPHTNIDDQIFGSSSDDEQLPGDQNQKGGASPSLDYHREAGASRPEPAVPEEQGDVFGELDSEEDQLEEGDEGGEPREGGFATGPPLQLEAALLPPFRSDELHLMRTSNILSIEPKHFSPEQFREDEGPDFDPDRSLGHLNVVRWRYVRDKHGDRIPQSNSRMVRWSDGSWSLLVGDEMLDASKQDIGVNQQYVFVRHQGQSSGQGIIQGQAKLSSRMGFQPSSLKSQSHLQLKAALERKHRQGDRLVQRVAALRDPQSELEARGKMMEMRIKGREMMKKQQQRSMQRFNMGPQAPGRLSRDFLEADDDDDDEYDAERRTRASQQRYDEEAEARAEKRILSSKKGGFESSATGKRKKQQSPDEDSEEPSPDDSDEEAAKPRKKRVMLSSDDEDDA